MRRSVADWPSRRAERAVITGNAPGKGRRRRSGPRRPEMRTGLKPLRLTRRRPDSIRAGSARRSVRGAGARAGPAAGARPRALAAARAGAVDVQAVAARREALAPDGLLLHALEARVAELRDAPALEADHVVVVLVAQRVLVERAA